MLPEQALLFEEKLMTKQRANLDVNILRDIARDWMLAKKDLLDVSCHCSKPADGRESVVVNGNGMLEDVPFCDGCLAAIRGARAIMDRLRASRVPSEAVAQA